MHLESARENKKCNQSRKLAFHALKGGEGGGGKNGDCRRERERGTKIFREGARGVPGKWKIDVFQRKGRCTRLLPPHGNRKLSCIFPHSYFIFAAGVTQERRRGLAWARNDLRLSAAAAAAASINNDQLWGPARRELRARLFETPVTVSFVGVKSCGVFCICIWKSAGLTRDGWYDVYANYGCRFFQCRVFLYLDLLFSISCVLGY